MSVVVPAGARMGRAAGLAAFEVVLIICVWPPMLTTSGVEKAFMMSPSVVP